MKLEDIRKLHQKKYRAEFGCFLVEGEHLVQELLKATRHDPRLRASEIYCTPDTPTGPAQLSTHVVNARQMMQISETRSPQGIAAVVPLLAAPVPRPGERAIYLHEIQDPGNLGTILRTLAWFGTFRCLLGPDSVDVHNGKAVRASMGAVFHVPVETDVPLDGTARRASAASPAWTFRGNRSPRLRSAISTATSSAMKPADCRARCWQRCMPRPSRSPVPRPSNR